MKSSGGNRVFWFGSLGIHALLLGVLFLSPVGERIFQPAERKLKPEIVRKDEKLAEVVDQVRDLAMDRMQAQLDLLEAGKERMHTDFNTLNAHYQPFKDAQLETLRARFQHAGRTTLERQARLLEALTTAVEVEAPDFENVRTAYDENRARIFTGQAEIRRALHLTAADGDSLVERQTALDQQQADAFEALAAALEAEDKRLHEINVLAVHTPKIEAAKAEHAEAAEALKTAETPAPKEKERVAQLHRKYLDHFYRGRMHKNTIKKFAEQRDAGLREAQQLQQTVNAGQEVLLEEALRRMELDRASAQETVSAETEVKEDRQDVL